MSEKITGIKGVLSDMDGVLYVGSQVIDGAAEAIRQLKRRGLPLRFLTNTTTRSQRSMHQKLVDLGLPIEPEECFGVIRAAQVDLRKLGNPKCYFLLTDDPKEDFAEFDAVKENPDIVLVGDVGKVWDYALMQKVFEMIMNGARLVALHKGRFWQTEAGLRMDLGAFVAGLEYVTKTTAVVLGKPNREMFQLALDDMGVSATEALMIGDDLDNDIAGAQQCGMKGVLVRTGKYREDILARSDVRPELIIDSLGDFIQLLK